MIDFSSAVSIDIFAACQTVRYNGRRSRLAGEESERQSPLHTHLGTMFQCRVCRPDIPLQPQLIALTALPVVLPNDTTRICLIFVRTNDKRI